MGITRKGDSNDKDTKVTTEARSTLQEARTYEITAFQLLNSPVEGHRFREELE